MMQCGQRNDERKTKVGVSIEGRTEIETSRYCIDVMQETKNQNKICENKKRHRNLGALFIN
jgi:hypothetical protein